jgi:hypothetical protein
VNISDEAVEAAHKAWRAQAGTEGTIFEYNLRAALEAAAPYLMAQAWDRCAASIVDEHGNRLIPYENTNPYRSQA